MTDARDRVLEQALERLLETEEHREARVRGLLAALERAGAAPAAAPPAELPPARLNGRAHAPHGAAAPARRRRALYGALAALAALLLALVALRLARSPSPVPEGPVVARAAAPLDVLGPAGPRRGPELRAGESARTGSEPARLELAGGGSLELGPQGLLAFGAERPDLVLGDLRCAGPCELDLGFARLACGAGGVATARLELPPDAAPAGAHPGEWYAAQGAPPARLLRLAAVAAPVRLTLGAEVLELRPGDVRVAGERDPPPGAITPEDKQEVLAQIEGLWEYKPGAPLDFPSEAKLKDFFAFLDQRPQRWDLLGDLARQELGDEKVPLAMRRAWIDLCCMAPSPRAFDLARALWLEVPELFEPWHVVTLAERGAFELEREARARVAAPDEDFADTALPAAWLALRGDADAALLLRRIEERPPDTRGELDRGWLAAYALAQAGDPAPFERRLRRLEPAVREALDQRATARASDLVLLAEFYLAEREAPGDAAGLLWRARAHVAARAAEVQSPGEILAALADLPR